MNLKKAFFVHNSVVLPIGQRGVHRCFVVYTKALIERYPGQVCVYSAHSVEFNNAKILKPPSTGIPAISKHLSAFDNLSAGIYADLTAQVYYSPFYGNARTKIPQVFTVYDMIFERFPHYFSRSVGVINAHIKEKKDCLERADLLRCISNNTAKDVIEMYPHIRKEKLKVIHIGVDELFFEGKKAGSYQRPYFLYVGNRDKYKNFIRFLTAFGKSELSKDFDLRIVSPINAEFNNEEVDIIQRYQLAECIKVLINVSDEALRDSYRMSEAFVCPSEYEGFGLPILEAMASGTLVLTSNVSSLPEIGGEAPLYFDPLSEDSIIDVLRVASQMSTAEREERIQKGKTWAAHFSWQRSKENFVNAIELLL